MPHLDSTPIETDRVHAESGAVFLWIPLHFIKATLGQGSHENAAYTTDKTVYLPPSGVALPEV